MLYDWTFSHSECFSVGSEICFKVQDLVTLNILIYLCSAYNEDLEDNMQKVITCGTFADTDIQ